MLLPFCRLLIPPFHLSYSQHSPALRCLLTEAVTMSEAEVLESVPEVEIDEGTFKYILMQVQVVGIMGHKTIVRGFRTAEFHNHIFEKVNPGLEALGLESMVLGGGKIQHERQKKKIRIYGESTGYGKADHSVTAEILKKAYKDYDVTWTDDK